ncbi:MAG: glycosyltransferase family 4 protein [Anaerolineae bacterium]|nr:glycosyltransferase family 4 protein [Anaerolineae bacterium]
MMLYVANVRMPTEKAHGYQIAQMCEAFALAGEEVKLVVPRRFSTMETNLWQYYGVRENFKMITLPCLDFIAFFPESKLAFLFQTFTFLLALLVWLPFQKYSLLFSRDVFLVAPLTLWVPRRKLIYEVHSKARSRRLKRIQDWTLRRVGLVVSLTGTMAEQLKQTGISSIIVAHDGIRPENFPLFSSEIRQELGIPSEAFVACYAGRLHTMGMSKGLEVFIEAAAQVKNIVFLLVGGPDNHVEQLRQRWQQMGMPPEDFFAVGTVPPIEVPKYLAAADVCLITSPQNEFFSNETSPMKLFEYMMAGRAILASDLPSTREVVQHGESAYLVPPSDVEALREALKLLRESPDLRQQLGHKAAQEVLNYTWLKRAESILKAAKV